MAQTLILIFNAPDRVSILLIIVPSVNHIGLVKQMTHPGPGVIKFGSRPPVIDFTNVSELTIHYTVTTRNSIKTAFVIS
jgi:hypothetical protein